MPEMITKFLGRTEKAPTAAELQEWAGVRQNARDVAKGFIIAKEGNDPFGASPLIMRFQYNPTQLTASKSINYAITEIPGSPNPLVEFLSGKETKWTFELQLHVPTQRELDFVINVTDRERQHIAKCGFVDFQLQKFAALTSSKARFRPPPLIEMYFPSVTATSELRKIVPASTEEAAFSSGALMQLAQSTSGTKIQGVISDYKVQLTMFDRFMRPMSAKIEITIIKAVPMAVSGRPLKKKSQSTREKVAPPTQKIAPTYFDASVEYLEMKYNVLNWKDLTAALGETGFRPLHDVISMNKQRGLISVGTGRIRDGVRNGPKGFLRLVAKGKFKDETGLRQWIPEAPNADNYAVNARTMTVVSGAGLDVDADTAYPYIALSPGPWEDVKLELPE